MKKKIPKDVYVHGCRIYAEDGDVKVQYSEEIERRDGDMSVEDFKDVLQAVVKMMYEMP